MDRAPCCEKVGLKRGRWTAEEDEILTKYIQAHGEGSWRSLPKNAGLLRCGKSCRLRWINYLRADLKRGNISHEEEEMIVKLHSSMGNKWSVIASHLPGRTDNEIKNYWNSHLSRKIHSFTKHGNERVSVILETTMKRRGGRTSRWAMNKNKTIPSRKPEPSGLLPHNSQPPVPSQKTVLEKQTLYGQINEGVNSSSYSGADHPLDIVMPSPLQETSGVPLKQKESLCLCPTGDQGYATEPSGVSGPCQNIDFDQTLCFDDAIDYDLLHPIGLLNLDEEGTQDNLLDREGDSHNLSSNGSSGSFTSSFDHDQGADWTWNDMIPIWDDKDDVPPWSWDGEDFVADENKPPEEIDHEKHSAIVSWLLS